MLSKILKSFIIYFSDFMHFWWFFPHFYFPWAIGTDLCCPLLSYIRFRWLSPGAPTFPPNSGTIINVITSHFCNSATVVMSSQCPVSPDLDPLCRARGSSLCRREVCLGYSVGREVPHEVTAQGLVLVLWFSSLVSRVPNAQSPYLEKESGRNCHPFALASMCLENRFLPKLCGWGLFSGEACRALGSGAPESGMVRKEIIFWKWVPWGL